MTVLRSVSLSAAWYCCITTVSVPHASAKVMGGRKIVLN